MGAKKISIDHFKDLSKDSLLELANKFLDKERLVKNLVIEAQTSTEEDDYFQLIEELKKNEERKNRHSEEDIEKFIKNVSFEHKKVDDSSKIARQFVREIEENQEKLAKGQNLNGQFIREIEKEQENLAHSSKIIKQLVRELEITQDQLTKSFYIFGEMFKSINKIQDLYNRLTHEEDLVVLSEIQHDLTNHIKSLRDDLAILSQKICLI